VQSCGHIDEDLGLDKLIPLGNDKTRNVSLGATFTNVFDRHELINLNSNIDNANFGTFASASFPRTVQMHVRIEF
jgi:hypothetical protein